MTTSNNHQHAFYMLGSIFGFSGYVWAIVVLVIALTATHHVNVQQTEIKQLQHQVQVLRHEVKS